VTTGVIETGEARVIGAIARDSVGAAAAGAGVFLLQAAEKTVKRTIMILRIQ
jgi:PDZ domain-containing secreted protein